MQQCILCVLYPQQAKLRMGWVQLHTMQWWVRLALSNCKV